MIDWSAGLQNLVFAQAEEADLKPFGALPLSFHSPQLSVLRIPVLILSSPAMAVRQKKIGETSIYFDRLYLYFVELLPKLPGALSVRL